MNSTTPRFRTGDATRLLVAWLVVGLPLAWGVWQVVVKSLVLFGVGD
jgi:uncharacterized membrane protein